jgi:uncharacterized protein YbjT (DUF2867 family)
MTTAWVAGATGLVGREVVAALLEDQRFTRVFAVVRRPTGVRHPRLDERTVDFESLERDVAQGSGDVALCALGSTIKQAGSQAQFRHIDHDYVIAFARAALSAGVRHFLVVTALGADPHARVFYNRVKGEVEEALAALPFAALTIARPSLLLGERSEFRIGERLFAPFSRVLPKSVRGIEARTVARALVRLAAEPAAGKRVVLSKELHDLGA